jgi:hypothetical protein
LKYLVVDPDCRRNSRCDQSVSDQRKVWAMLLEGTNRQYSHSRLGYLVIGGGSGWEK